MTQPDAAERAEADVVQLPPHLLERVDRRLPRSEFDSRDEYVAFVLREVLSRAEAADDDEDGTAVDEAEVKSRLESLGYIDS